MVLPRPPSVEVDLLALFLAHHLPQTAHPTRPYRREHEITRHKPYLFSAQCVADSLRKAVAPKRSISYLPRNRYYFDVLKA
jgi:hypothetical protein